MLCSFNVHDSYCKASKQDVPIISINMCNVFQIIFWSMNDRFGMCRNIGNNVGCHAKNYNSFVYLTFIQIIVRVVAYRTNTNSPRLFEIKVIFVVDNNTSKYYKWFYSNNNQRNAFFKKRPLHPTSLTCFLHYVWLGNFPNTVHCILQSALFHSDSVIIYFHHCQLQLPSFCKVKLTEIC